MTPRDRVVAEILVPAPLGTALWVTWHFTEFQHHMGFAPEVLVPYFLVAYAFAIIPSCVYALLVELSLRRRWWRRFGPMGFVGYSTGLGSLAGVAIGRASGADVIGIGAIVGLLLGILLAGTVGSPAIRASSPPAA